MNKPFAPDRLIGAAPAFAPARFTADEFLRMAKLGAFDDMKVELVHGEIIRMTLPNNPHASVQARIIGKLFVATDGAAGLRGDVGIRLSAIRFGASTPPWLHLVQTTECSRPARSNWQLR